MQLKSGFKVLRFSDCDYEKLTAELRFDGNPIAQINQDKGPENLEIEFMTEFYPGFTPKYRLADLIEAIEVAKYRLGLIDELPKWVRLDESS